MTTYSITTNSCYVYTLANHSCRQSHFYYSIFFSYTYIIKSQLWSIPYLSLIFLFVYFYGFLLDFFFSYFLSFLNKITKYFLTTITKLGLTKMYSLLKHLNNYSHLTGITFIWQRGIMKFNHRLIGNSTKKKGGDTHISIDWLISGSWFIHINELLLIKCT